MPARKRRTKGEILDDLEIEIEKIEKNLNEANKDLEEAKTKKDKTKINKQIAKLTGELARTNAEFKQRQEVEETKSKTKEHTEKVEAVSGAMTTIIKGVGETIKAKEEAKKRQEKELEIINIEQKEEKDRTKSEKLKLAHANRSPAEKKAIGERLAEGRAKKRKGQKQQQQEQPQQTELQKKMTEALKQRIVEQKEQQQEQKEEQKEETEEERINRLLNDPMFEEIEEKAQKQSPSSYAEQSKALGKKVSESVKKSESKIQKAREAREAQREAKKTKAQLEKLKAINKRIKLEKESQYEDEQRYLDAKKQLKTVAEQNNYLNLNSVDIIKNQGVAKWKAMMNQSDDELQEINFIIGRFEAGIPLENINKSETLLQDYGDVESELKEKDIDFTSTKGKYREAEYLDSEEEEEEAKDELSELVQDFTLKIPQESKYQARNDNYFDNRQVNPYDFDGSNNRMDSFDEFEIDNKHNDDVEYENHQDRLLNEMQYIEDLRGNPEAINYLIGSSARELEKLDRQIIRNMQDMYKSQGIDGNPDDVYTISEYNQMFGTSDEDEKNNRERYINAIQDYMSENQIRLENYDIQQQPTEYLRELAEGISVSDDISVDTFAGVYSDAMNIYGRVKQSGYVDKFLEHPTVANSYMGRALAQLDQQIAEKDGKLNNLPNKLKNIFDAMSIPVKVMAGEASPGDVITAVKGGLAVKDIVSGAYDVIRGKRITTEPEEKPSAGTDEEILEAMRRLQNRGDLPLKDKLRYPEARALKDWHMPDTDQRYNAVPLIQNSIIAYLNDQNLYGGGNTSNFSASEDI